jgi:hypothetical protein
MIDDHVGRECPDAIPLGIPKASHQRTHVLQQFKAGAEAVAAGHGGFSLRGVEQRQEFARQRHERHAAIADQSLELLRCCELHRMPARHEAKRQREIRLNIPTRAERLDGDPHATTESCTGRCRRSA